MSYFYPDQSRTKVNENALKGKKGHLSTENRLTSRQMENQVLLGPEKLMIDSKNIGKRCLSQ